ncbi:hypothetical protein NliqN6_2270 [Naganishia liquefaciens]|uniref:Chromatin modification-related protein n=1 Tax=Naganishia liquefaciens TaxID=104408 RepID=A0A8H3YE40_9TREE|nr:hypothetical protein NliqN6_2270 [Naganishia liquefaciens]
MATVDADSAVAIAAEFFASLDNAPAEVAFLLDEIRTRDHTIMEHLRKAESRGNSLYRSVRQSTSTPQSDRGTVLNPSTPKDAQTQSRIMAEYTKIEHLQEEKIALAAKLARIITRHRERARDEWRKIVGDEAVGAWDAAQEEEISSLTSSSRDPGAQVGLSAIAYQVARMPVSGSVGQVMAQLVQKSGLASGIASPSIDEKSSKKRKAGTSTPASGYFDPQPTSRSLPSGPLPSHISSPHPLATTYTPQPGPTRDKKSRRIASETPDDDAFAVDAPDPDEFVAPLDTVIEAETGDAVDADDTLYCFCQEKSHGQMIGCDNSACRFEWFHVKCMKLDPDKLPATWFCPECVKILGFMNSTGEKAASASTSGAGGDKAGYKKPQKGRKK